MNVIDNSIIIIVVLYIRHTVAYAEFVNGVGGGLPFMYNHV